MWGDGVVAPTGSGDTVACGNFKFGAQQHDKLVVARFEGGTLKVQF